MMIGRVLKNISWKEVLAVHAFVLLFAGQGFRNLLGLWGYGAVSAVTVILLIMVFRKNWNIKKTPFLLACFVILATLSVFWSEYRLESLIASVILIITTLAGILLASSFAWKKLIVLLGYGLQITVAGSLLFEAIVTFIIQHPILPVFMEFVSLADVDADAGMLLWSENHLLTGGPIQGFMGNRNLLGFVALLLIVVALITALEKLNRAWVSVMWIAVGLTIHWLTTSATISLALIAVLVITAGALVVRKVPERWKKPASWSFVAACMALGVVAMKNQAALFSVFDREPNLSSRTDIWEAVATLALQRPEGWGWVSYWPVWIEPFKSLYRLDGVPVSHAHNAFIDVWLQLGVLGVLILAAMAFYLLFSSWRAVEHSNHQDTYLILGIFLLTGCLFMQSLTESRLLLEGNWLLLTILMMYSPPALKKVKLKSKAKTKTAA